MSHFTEYQVQKYKKLFHKFSSHETGRLTLHDLQSLLCQFGAEMPTTMVRELMYSYDRHCIGTLDFCDFIILLGDYELLLDEEKQRAERAFFHFQQKTPRGGLTRDEFATILQTSTGSDGAACFSIHEIQEVLDDYFNDISQSSFLTSDEFVERNGFSGLAWASHQPPPTAKDSITRDIHVCVMAAHNLHSLANMKVRRGQKIEYGTLDAFVSVSCAGVTQETTVLIGEVAPEWQQDLLLQVKFPAVDFYELQRWIENQKLVFNLYDYVITGAVPHVEWLATGSIPLTTVLRTDGSPLIISLALRAPTIMPPPHPALLLSPVTTNSVAGTPIVSPLSMGLGRAGVCLGSGGMSGLGSDNMKLEVSVRVNVDAITPYFELPEEIWINKYNTKARQDLIYGLRTPDQSESTTDISTNSPRQTLSFFEFYYEFYQQLKTKFRRRTFQLIGLNEYNQFLCLSTFIRPLYTAPSFVNPHELARNVARIGTYGGGIPSGGTHVTAQVASPALMLFRKVGTPLEHAILLCDLFLGIGLHAYVCIGTAFGEMQAWVATYNTPLKTTQPSGGISSLAASSSSLFTSMEGQQRSPTKMPSSLMLTSQRSFLFPSGLAGSSPPGTPREGRAMPVSLTAAQRIASIDISPPTSDEENDDVSVSETKPLVDKTKFVRLSARRASHAVTDADPFRKRRLRKPARRSLFSKSYAALPNVHSRKMVLEMNSQSPLRTIKETYLDGNNSSQNNSSQNNSSQNNSSQNSSRSLSSNTSGVSGVGLVSTFSGEKFAAFHTADADRDGDGDGDEENQVTFWNPTNGRAYQDSTATNFPYTTVGCMFNNQNVYINVQKYDSVLNVSWDVNKIENWLPLLDEDVVDTFGPTQCWYSEPPQLGEAAREWEAFDNTEQLVKDIATTLQLYRRQSLYIPDTTFLRPICKILQQATQHCEEYMLSLNTSVPEMDRSFIQKIETDILAALPDHHMWYGKPYHFHTSDIDEIMHQLVWTGILDCTVPHAFYAFGAQVFEYPWGMQSVWVYIGYCFDLLYDTK